MDYTQQPASSMDTLAVRLGVLHEDVGEIKTALSKLSDAITKLALVEERQMQTSVTLDRIAASLETLDSRVDTLERAQPKNTETAKWMDRVITAVVVAAAAFVARSVGLM
jgi:chaperonin cofactor prefoldin